VTCCRSGDLACLDMFRHPTEAGRGDPGSWCPWRRCGQAASGRYRAAGLPLHAGITAFPDSVFVEYGGPWLRFGDAREVHQPPRTVHCAKTLPRPNSLETLAAVRANVLKHAPVDFSSPGRTLRSPPAETSGHAGDRPGSLGINPGDGQPRLKRFPPQLKQLLRGRNPVQVDHRHSASRSISGRRAQSRASCVRSEHMRNRLTELVVSAMSDGYLTLTDVSESRLRSAICRWRTSCSSSRYSTTQQALALSGGGRLGNCPENRSTLDRKRSITASPVVARFHAFLPRIRGQTVCEAARRLELSPRLAMVRTDGRGPVSKSPLREAAGRPEPTMI